MRKIWRNLKLMAVLIHSDFHTDFYRLKLRYKPESIKE